MTDITYCTSHDCCHKDRCARQIVDDPDDKYLSFYNFEYGGCDLDSGYDNFIPIYTESVKA